MAWVEPKYTFKISSSGQIKPEKYWLVQKRVKISKFFIAELDYQQKM